MVAAYEDHAHRAGASARHAWRRGTGRPRPGAAVGQERSPRPARGRDVRVVRRPRDSGVPVPAAERVAGSRRAGDRLPARRPDRRLRRRVGRPRAVLRGQRLRLARRQLPRLDRLRPRLRAAQSRRVGRGRHEGLPGRGGLPADARLGGRRPAGHLRRQLRLVHVAVRGHVRPRAPLPLRGAEVRRLRHHDLVGAGRPQRRAGPRADDGHAGPGARRVHRRARPTTGSRTSRCRS